MEDLFTLFPTLLSVDFMDDYPSNPFISDDPHDGKVRHRIERPGGGIQGSDQV